MKTNKIYIAFLVLGLLCIETYSKHNSLNIDESKVLFISKSFTGCNDMPSIEEELTNSTRNQIYIDEFLLYGNSLYEISFAFGLERKINSKKWDCLFVQDSPYRIAYLDKFKETNSLRIALKKVKKLAL